MARTLGVVRLSMLTDDTTSPARQREIIETAARARGDTIVGWAEDLDVSATKFAPTKRPDLGQWLERPDEWDELLFWRVDRFIRKVSDLAEMIAWAEKHGKNLKSATEDFDLKTPFGRAMAYLIGIFAEMESSNTSERVTGAHAYLRRQGRWGGGKPLYGYRAVPNPDGNGYVLVIDDEAADLCREAARRVIAGESVNSITADFNRRAIPTPQNLARARAGKQLATRKGRDTSGALWRVSALTDILRNPALLGYVTHQDSPVTGTDGTPIVRAPALVTETEWNQLQRELSDPARTRNHRRTRTPSLLLDVATCALCGSSYYRWTCVRRGRTWAYYRCAGGYKPAEVRAPCAARAIPSPGLDALAETLFAAQVGHVEIMERVYRPGVDHSDEVALLRRSLAQVTTDYDAGVYSYPGGQDDYDKRVTGLSARLRAVADLPVTEAGYEYRPTGQTFADRWQSSDVQGRRQLMLNAGFQLRVSRTRIHTPIDAAETKRLTALHERSLQALLAGQGLSRGPDGAAAVQMDADAWEKIRGLADPQANLVIAWRLDPDLARRAGLAAEGRPVTVPDVDAAWREALAPVRQHIKGKR